jgi:hypothetical protein
MGLPIGASRALPTVGRQAVWQIRGGYETTGRGHRVARAACHTLLIRIVGLNGIS